MVPTGACCYGACKKALVQLTINAVIFHQVRWVSAVFFRFDF